MYFNNLLDTNTTHGNFEDTVRKYSLSSELSKLKKKHKELNSLIHIYSHKAQYDIESTKKKSYSTNIQTQYISENESQSGMFLTINNIKSNGKYPIMNIKYNPILHQNNRKYTDDSKKGNTKYNSLDSKKLNYVNYSMSSPERRENTHKRLKEFRERERIRIALNAQDLKEKNKVLKENIIIFRAKTINENIQKKKLVETQMRIQKNSIENYQLLKKNHINKLLSNDLEKEIKKVNKKEKELLFWKTEYDKKIILKEKNKSCNIRNIMLN